MPPKIIFAAVGEVSGVRLLDKILPLIEKSLPDLQVVKLGGSGGEIRDGLALFPLKRLARNGVLDVLLALPYFAWVLFRTHRWLSTRRPSLVLFVDYPGLNLRLMKHCTRLGIPFYYVAPPQRWAYKNQILPQFRGTDVQVLFPMEKTAYEKMGCRVLQGHFFDIPKVPDRRPPFERNSLLLCPGSRSPVIKRNLFLFERLLRNTSAPLPLNTRLIVLVPGEYKSDVLQLLKNHTFTLPLSVAGPGEVSFAHTWGALAFPGTFNVELALREIPAVILARVDLLTYWAGKRYLKTRSISLPNILTGTALYPERIEFPGKPIEQKHFDSDLTAMIRTPFSVPNFVPILGSANGADLAAEACLKKI